MKAVKLFFEDRRTPDLSHPGLLFLDPVDELICFHPEHFMASLEAVNVLRQKGYYLAGYLSYEAGYILRDLAECVKTSSFPLMHFFAFKAPQRLTALEVGCCLAEKRFSVHDFLLNITPFDYESAFKHIQKCIIAGDTYQVNFTSKYQFRLDGDAEGLYMALRERQKVAYAAYLSLPEGEILSLSPELFFAKKKNKMQVKPMKGTMPRDLDKKRDEANRVFLSSDEKSQAENTMIVDLLRNDLSMISYPGSVFVSQLLAVESYETVHQMISCIESEVPQDLTFSKLIQALFPCGSITGAPKRRTMQIIHALEREPRHVYTGALGYITPENDMLFNVPIRTILLQNNQGELGVGGGIIYDSVMQSEFEELQLKAAFFRGLL